jgi:peptide/nickel transport system permease protein
MPRDPVTEAVAATVPTGLGSTVPGPDHPLPRRRAWPLGRRRSRTARRIFGLPLGAALSAGWLLLLVAAALLADVLPIAEAEVAARALSEPTLARPGWSRHPLGTDRQGLDLLGGIVHGARISLVVGIGGAAIGLAIGGSLGLVAGFVRGWFDRMVSVLTDTMLAFPPLILLLGLVAVLDPSVTNVTIGLATLSIPTYVRLARANTMVVAQQEYVLAARAIGAPRHRILLRDILPNVVRPLLTFSILVVASLIVAEAALSFLGLSVQRPTPTWGNMISAGQDQFDRHPHLVLVPGVCMFLTVYALNRLGEQLQGASDDQRS